MFQPSYAQRAPSIAAPKPASPPRADGLTPAHAPPTLASARCAQSPLANSSAPRPTAATRPILTTVSHRRHPAAQRDRTAVDERRHRQRDERHDLQVAERYLVPERAQGDVHAVQCAAHQDVEKDGKPHGECRLGRRARDQALRPTEQKRPPPAVGLANVDVLPAGIGHHRRQLGVGEGAGKREQACDDPHREHQARRTDVARHHARLEKDARADHVGDVDRRRGGETETAHECRVTGRHPVSPDVRADHCPAPVTPWAESGAQAFRQDCTLMRVHPRRILRRPRLSLTSAVACVVLGLSVLMSASALPMQGRRGRGFGRQVPINNTWIYDGSFVFCRIAFRQNPYGDGGGWSVDYPRADLNLPFRMGQLRPCRSAATPAANPITSSSRSPTRTCFNVRSS